MKVIYDDNLNVPIKCWASELEDGALEQARNMANLPNVFHHVALMPDAHQGYGVPIGGVLALEGAISPNAVGVDVSCGMRAVNTGIHFDDIKALLPDIRNDIRNNIPLGFSQRNPHQVRQDIKIHLNDIMAEFYEGHGGDICQPAWYVAKNDIPFENYVLAAVGTLGGGNHFIELQVDESDVVWVMIHSGSRNIGKQVADYHNKVAERLCAQWFTPLPNKDLAFLPMDSDEGKSYLHDMNFAVRFAKINREYILSEVLEIISNQFDILSKTWAELKSMFESIDVSHNYAQLENHFGRNVVVHRKGATSARSGQVGIIPGSMGTSSYIVEGLGNPDSFHSCSHGAGRCMGRKQASRTISMEEFEASMDGIVYDVCEDNLDEAPQAYKSIDEVMENQKDLVKITHRLRPIAVVKG